MLTLPHIFALSYDAIAAVGLVRAAERAKSPAILQIFPVTMREQTQSFHFTGRAYSPDRPYRGDFADWGGKPFLAFLLDLAHSASAPVSVHLDHATTEEDIDTALRFVEEGVPFDSIMVDASHADTDEENLEVVSRGFSPWIFLLAA